MERMRKVISWSNRPPELNSVLPSYCNMILTSVEGTRPRIHDCRKHLEKSTIFFPSSWSNIDLGTIRPNCPLWSLIKTQELLNEQNKFLKESVRELVMNLKSWEDECSQLLKTKVDLQWALMDMNKVKDKQRQGKDNESVKDLITATESAYNSQRETLFKDLSHYLQSETNYQARIKKFLEEQAKSLDLCKTKTDNLLNATCATSAFMGETPSGSYFGSSLRDHLDDQGYSVVLKMCLSYLMKGEAYTKKGIFRIPGQVTYITLLRGAIDNDEVDDSLLDLCGVDVVADVMKQYLRELPEPLLSSSFIENWPGETSSSSKIISVIREHLPKENQKNFLLLLQFLLKVYKNEETSKMSVDNLALLIWISLCPNSIIIEGASIVKQLLAHAEDLVGEENSLSVLESLSTVTISKAPLSINQTAYRPQKPARNYPPRPCVPVANLKARSLAPPPPPPSKYTPQASVRDVGNLSSANTQLSSVDVPYQQQLSLTNVPVTTFDNNSYRRTSSALATNTPSQMPTPAPPLSSSDNFVGRESTTAITSDTELSRRESTPSNPASVTKVMAQRKEEEGNEEEEEEEDKSEGKTSSENSVNMETSTTDSSTKNVDEHKHEKKNRNDTDESKKKEKVEKFEKSSTRHAHHSKHLKAEKGDEKRKADAKMRSDRTDVYESSETPSSDGAFDRRRIS
ncbi:SH3 domain-binding protein 1 [Taenia crassiceps]|uniref:SH3 domain-binding protein 1 n=1 Tax=Taenia crassiceps TaxID=6207 RepID=A0ABR4Q5Z0_9CEST